MSDERAWAFGVNAELPYTAPNHFGRPVTREDRIRAVWHGFRYAARTGRMDALMEVSFHNHRAGRGFRVNPTVQRWHIHLRPWCYPDPNPMPRLTLRRLLFAPAAHPSPVGDTDA